MAKRVTLALISEECLAQFTWTGKAGKKGIKKNKFNCLKLIHAIIVAALSKLDSSYNLETFKNDMVNHVIKYAYLVNKKDNNDLKALSNAPVDESHEQEK